METLNEILKRLKQLEADTGRNTSNFQSLTEIASFMDDLPDIVQQLESELIEQETKQSGLTKFYDYFSELYGTGLEVANWHQNGDTEPFDNFFDSAEQELEG